MSKSLSPDRIIQLRQILLDWYDHSHRDLPWRGETDPYRVWVSEIMLQQTQVRTVMPYYHRFLQRFPTLADLAAASLDEVLKAWEGLGYYARARNLHAAARQVMEEHDGQIPNNLAALRQLPGLGDYTAGAVASITFGEPVPAVDGNVKRVLTRLFAITDNISLGTTSRRLRDLAADLLPPGRPGDFNQALMELGAVVCTPVSPQCLMCPVREVCGGWVQGIQEMLPVRRERGKLPHHDVAAGVIRRQDGHLLIARRNVTAMLGGLWGFPGGRCRAGESLPDCLHREVSAQLGVDIAVDQPLITIRHSYTHFRIALHVFECGYLGGEPQTVDGADWRWVKLDNLADLAFPVTDQKIIARLRGG